MPHSSPRTLILLSVAFLSAGCIMRKPGTGPSATGSPGATRASSGSAKFAAARSVDLLGANGTFAFEPQGDVRKIPGGGR